MSTPDEEYRKRKREFDQAKRHQDDVLSPDSIDNYPNVVPPLLRAAGAPANTNAAEQVTPVDIPRSIFTHPFQDTITVKLPYQYTKFGQLITLATARSANDVFTTSFRLNSPVDVITSYAYTADPYPTADVQSGEVNSRMYWNYYNKLYRYYTVVHSKYNIKVRPTGSAGVRFSAWTYHHGSQGPYIMDASFMHTTTRKKLRNTSREL
ncbi:hypothetical protein AaE_001073 [Aphanomyces astaci]|uniref:Uncharacterized protein n=1 Tax=Aphanomyces astaci TaxID=112090 RepID=A0A6A5AU13_APHAT|nr:hypothetical protein AaE_001073 [Aphanomyces astaci]